MVLAEAAATGLPLLSTDVGAIHEIVRQGETGELVPPGDVAALTAALRRLVTDGAARGAYGEAALRLARSDHDARVNAGRIASILADAARTGAH
jgi:2-deoxystreptamine N-acetyl-D-glucosaminyltransferase/2-deoxystreptamine glucosyltransferase